jgi:galactose mutarotase-like enzyme
MLKIKTDLPALNMFSGNYPVNDLLLNRGGYLYRYQSLALEPQLIPNDINNWIIEKDKPFLGHICYEFSLTTD